MIGIGFWPTAAGDLRVVSMNRPAADDPVLFEAAAAAGVVAATNIAIDRIP